MGSAFLPFVGLTASAADREKFACGRWRVTRSSLSCPPGARLVVVCGGGDQKETEAETSPEPFELPTSMVIPHPSASACVSEMPQSVLVEVDDGEGDKV